MIFDEFVRFDEIRHPVAALLGIDKPSTGEFETRDKNGLKSESTTQKTEQMSNTDKLNTHES